MISRNRGSLSGVWLLAGVALAAALTVGSQGVPLFANAARRAEPQAGGQGASAAATQGRGGSPAPPPGAGAPGQGSRQGFSAGWKWWNDEAVKKEIGLTDDKAKKIDEFVQDRERQLKPLADDYQKERDELDRMTSERLADDSTYGLKVWRVESMRAKLNESRIVLLYRIYKQLSPEQYKKLNEVLDRARTNMMGRGRSEGPRR